MSGIIDAKSTILIVDDMQENIALLISILGNEYNIKIAKSGSKAIEIVNRDDVDLILLDIVMPDMDGYEVCKELQNSEKTKEIPVIFVTGNTQSKDEELGFSLGAVDYITKPYNPTIIKARINTQISLKRKNKALNDLSKSLYNQNIDLARYIKLVDQNVITSSTTIEGNITQVSKAFCKISGYERDELIGKNHRIIRHPDMQAKVYEEMWSTIIENRIWRGEIKNLKKDGSFYWVDATISPVFDENREKIGYTAIRQDITDKKLIEEISITDGLTNIYNRRHFNDIFPKIINGARRDNELISFLLLDIDNFKQYNDNYGHQKGDSVLVEFAKCLKNHLNRCDDWAFRLGGEEFGVLFKPKDRAKAIEFANDLKKSIEDMKLEHKYSLVSQYITASIGAVCSYANDIKSVDDIYKQADDLLYKSKKDGRNRVSINS